MDILQLPSHKNRIFFPFYMSLCYIFEVVPISMIDNVQVDVWGVSLPPCRAYQQVADGVHEIILC